MRQSNSVTSRCSKAGRWPSATPPRAELSPLPATKHANMACDPPCRRSPRCASVRNSCSSRPEFEVYRAVSRQIRTIFTDYTPLVEPLSLDEAYLDVTDNLKNIPTAWATAKEIRARILDETGLTASAGVSYNKFLAKLASDCRKPNGQFAIMPDQGEAFVASLPVAKFHGVGPVTAAKMQSLGIESGADLRRRTLAFLQQHFGKSGPWYFEIARGHDNRAVRPDRERKSSGSETTFREDLTEPQGIEAGVVAMAEDVWAWCERSGFRGRTVTVKIKWADFQQSTRSRSWSFRSTAKAN